MTTVTVPYIQTEADNEAALARIYELWDVEEGTQEFAERETLSILVEAFERRAYPIDPPTPQALVRSLMDDRNMKQGDLIPVFGSSSRISEFLSGKRALSKDQAVLLHVRYGLPLDLLLSVYDLLREDEAEARPSTSPAASLPETAKIVYVGAPALLPNHIGPLGYKPKGEFYKPASSIHDLGHHAEEGAKPKPTKIKPKKHQGS